MSEQSSTIHEPGTFWCKSQLYPTIKAYHAARGHRRMILAEAIRQARAHAEAYNVHTVVYQNRAARAILSFWCDEHTPGFADFAHIRAQEVIWSSSTGYY